MFKSFLANLNPCSRRSNTKSELPSTINPHRMELEPSESCSRHEIPDTETSFTFKVDPVEFAKGPRYFGTAEGILRKGLLSRKQDIHGGPLEFEGRIEDFSHREDKEEKYLGAQVYGLVGVIHNAFQSHYALSLSVSDFIILTGQGLGTHINKNAEKLRRHFVDHEGKETIEVRRDHFVCGQQNDWSAVFEEFAEQIQKKTKVDVYGVVIDDTSVATTTSRIVSEITLMEAMKSYFSYEMETRCGIPQITLEGRREDWQKLKDKVRKLVEMNKADCLGLNYWLDQLVPVVDKICEAGIKRKVDREFWSSIYKYRSMSGGDTITGWITIFFPSLCCYSMKQGKCYREIAPYLIPKQVCEVPFIWDYFGNRIPMVFTAGFLGAEFNEKLYQVKAALFWCVTQAEEKEEKSL